MGPYLDRTVDADKDHRRRTRGANHEILMATTDGYRNQADAEDAVVLTAEAIFADEQLADRLEPIALAFIERRMAGIF